MKKRFPNFLSNMDMDTKHYLEKHFEDCDICYILFRDFPKVGEQILEHLDEISE